MRSCQKRVRVNQSLGNSAQTSGWESGERNTWKSAGNGEAGRRELSRDGEGRASAEEEGSLSSGTPKEINENTLSPTKAYYNDTPFIMAYATQCVRRWSFQVRR